MSNINLGNITSRMSALTPSGNGNNDPAVNGSSATNTTGNAEMDKNKGTETDKNKETSQSANSSGTGAKGKEANPPEKTITSNQGNKQKGKDSISRMEHNFCEYFGAAPPKLPKIKKIQRVEENQTQGPNQATPSKDSPFDFDEETRKKKLKEAYARLEEIKKMKEELQTIINLIKSQEKSAIDLTDSHTDKTHSPNSSSALVEGGLSFDLTKAPDASSFSLPIYFHKNMQALQGSLPLTVFNKSWQQAASNTHTEYKKSDKDNDKYRGHPVPSEWTQSRYDWTENMDNLITTCREVCKYIGFADSMEIHKKRVMTIFKQQRSWVVAFRYDLTVRKAVFAIRNPGASVPNPALEPTGLLDEIYYSARSQNDLVTSDNPYRTGGPKFGKNPYSDITTDLPTSQTSYQANSQASSSSRPQRVTPYAKGPSLYGNYKGRNFNANYKRPESGKKDYKGKGKEKKE
ncbi:uncharacterized protein MELLADRAFT_107804 [Melampsora larici-populina 98AG31]|uniref:Uncharacterized protein n=1 Tax=Melampsora larici-populina (strain 98AG31 / pathotype 3-4-7) TaxID=747676 RepID=F4RR00_MELLP|nr:uncharacterized protein MELLADRAFT_107804 [Melampsora larici-populina 98AG31]EGG05125.1 hypothetical protein MELLADRAFT_107804 [Melampsora larici-populina 98AG31]